ncbi:hypothetical protein PI172_0424 [Prevotella intermedia]|uniref:Uncharacterized protein n=1 Tax=Prevotella intermedia TaxID=28131 RepID=A0AAD1F6J7_PREIN|nr:hypothetical protein PI172_0424 [Prevotella intermedia]
MSRFKDFAFFFPFTAFSLMLSHLLSRVYFRRNGHLVG